MNRFQRFIKRIGGEDKVLHIETCCLITMVVALLNMNLLGLGIAASAVSACLIAVIAEKDEVIADLGKELAAQKDLVDDISLKYDGAKHNLKLRMDECEKLKKQLDSNTKMVQEMAEIIVHKKPVTVDVFKKCWIMAYSEEELSKVLDDVIDQFLLFGEIIIKE